VRLRPKVEVEMKDIALALVAAGIGDTYLSSAYTHAPYYPAGLTTAPFRPALYDTVAIVTRPGARLSPGVRELLGAVEAHMRTVAERFDRSRASTLALDPAVRGENEEAFPMDRTSAARPADLSRAARPTRG
jgi:hypothetical protein